MSCEEADGPYSDSWEDEVETQQIFSKCWITESLNGL